MQSAMTIGMTFLTALVQAILIGVVVWAGWRTISELSRPWIDRERAWREHQQK